MTDYISDERLMALADLLQEARESALHRRRRGERPVEIHRAACLYVAEQLRRATVAR